ncbi:unnamed protein product [Orchesella dallaii]|uniref:Uncharacterized protein n=1 Tax=Orchesella dallaii TaxID=48710 RepID=A0ABP1Q691_9HEXA
MHKVPIDCENVFVLRGTQKLMLNGKHSNITAAEGSDEVSPSTKAVRVGRITLLPSAPLILETPSASSEGSDEASSSTSWASLKGRFFEVFRLILISKAAMQVREIRMSTNI